MRLVLTALLALMLPFAANAQEREIQRADNAVRVLSEILQIPEDMIRMQEVIFRVRPDVIVETGIAHGGSLIYYASLCRNPSLDQSNS